MLVHRNSMVLPPICKQGTGYGVQSLDRDGTHLFDQELVRVVEPSSARHLQLQTSRQNTSVVCKSARHRGMEIEIISQIVAEDL